MSALAFQAAVVGVVLTPALVIRTVVGVADQIVLTQTVGVAGWEQIGILAYSALAVIGWNIGAAVQVNIETHAISLEKPNCSCHYKC